MNRMFVVRLAVMLTLAMVLAARMGLLPRGAGPRAYARGSAGASSGENGASEVGAAGDAPSLTGAPLTALAGTFTDPAGRTRTLAEFRGAPFVASVVYTRCTTVCPRVMAELARFERSAGGGERPRFVLFSLDPAHDTPATLRAFAAEHSLDSTRWTLLLPEPAALPPLASALGVAWRPLAGGGIAHSAVIAVVDRTGRVRERHVGLDETPDRLVAAWRAAL